MKTFIFIFLYLSLSASVLAAGMLPAPAPKEAAIFISEKSGFLVPAASYKGGEHRGIFAYKNSSPSKSVSSLPNPLTRGLRDLFRQKANKYVSVYSQHADSVLQHDYFSFPEKYREHESLSVELPSRSKIKPGKHPLHIAAVRIGPRLAVAHRVRNSASRFFLTHTDLSAARRGLTSGIFDDLKKAGGINLLKQMGNYLTGKKVPLSAFLKSAPLRALPTIIGKRILAVRSAAMLSRLSVSIFRNAAVQVAGAAVASGILSYGEYLLGYSDLKTANRNMVANIAGSSVGAGAAAVAACLVLNYGSVSAATAAASILGPSVMSGIYSIFGSSAVAGLSGFIGPVSISGIAGISGPSALSATIAWFGGGFWAGGGAGAASGSVILSGGAVLISAAVGAGVYYLYKLSDEKTERKRVAHLVESVAKNISNAATN